MEKDKRAVPPMPKLPEQNPEQNGQKKQKLALKQKLVPIALGLLLVGLLVLFGAFLLKTSRGPRQAVNAFVGQDLSVQEELVMASLPQNSRKSVYFYIAQDKLACALLSQGIGGISVQDAVGNVRLTAEGTQGVWKLLGSGKKDFLVFGILYDERMHNVTVNGQKAVVVSNGTYRLWYYHVQNGMSIDSESVIYAP